MANFLKQGTAVTVTLGPLIDDTDFKTPETVAFNAAGIDVNLIKGSTKGDRTLRVDAGDGYWAHLEDGYHALTLGAGDTDTLGSLVVTFMAAGVLPFQRTFEVVPAAIYETLVAGSTDLAVVGSQMDLVDAPNAAALEAIGGATWEELRAAHTAAGSFGELVLQNLNFPVAHLAGFRPWASEGQILTPNPGDTHSTFMGACCTGVNTYVGFECYWNGGKGYIGRLTSADGHTWVRDLVNRPVLAPGAGGSWESTAVLCPKPFVYGGRIWMYYSGRNATGNSQVGLAQSTDIAGTAFVKVGANPLIVFGAAGEWDNADCEMCDVIRFDYLGHTYWYVWYGTVGGIGSYNRNRKMGLAVGTDSMTVLVKDPDNPIWEATPVGMYMGGVFCYRNRCYMMACMGNYASTARWIGLFCSPEYGENHQINVMEAMKMKQRQFCRAIWDNRDKAGAFNDTDIDTPFMMNYSSYKSLDSADGILCYVAASNGVVWTEELLFEADIVQALEPAYLPASYFNESIFSYYHGHGKYALLGEEGNAWLTDILAETYTADQAGKYLQEIHGRATGKVITDEAGPDTIVVHDSAGVPLFTLQGIKVGSVTVWQRI
jgi:hypothetical protein